ncbi:hypothetical protein CLV46_1177 [Diaminobutyricimonas aerilata]|uniref:BFN domain-containing protein n=1 Tax=Diaminobutyricimonas aerilata TaxID=1162967 RepID=A0A2M9CI78_9MICO|nr:bifunctional nuclease family protein [Diaminobutyricimonas aerilata]PJJ71626.1 hypothetical protein CLV46_1177 [Diaminobutyricimonas aerilata]
MTQVRIAGIAIDVRGQHVVLLKPMAGNPRTDRVLPIWIGEQEATSILIAIEGAQAPRPLSHDLMKTLLETVGATVERVEVTRLDEGTYFAELSLRVDGRPVSIDCRPSDAIALASRTGAPLWVADEVMAAASVDDDFTSEPDEEEKLEEFKKFLDEVDPEDFQG